MDPLESLCMPESSYGSFGFPRIPANWFGFLWIAMDSSDFLWIAMAWVPLESYRLPHIFCEVRWVPMISWDSNGFRWVPMHSSVCMWIPLDLFWFLYLDAYMDGYEFLWILIDFLPMYCILQWKRVALLLELWLLMASRNFTGSARSPRVVRA